MAQVKKITDEVKKLVLADYVSCGNASETGRKYGISEASVRRIVARSSETVTKAVEEKHEEQLQSTLAYMDGQSEKKRRIIDKLLTAIESKSENVDVFTNVKDLATAYGIIIDKEIKLAEIRSKQLPPEKEKEIDALSASLYELAGELDADQ